ncbi:CoA ester lyase [Bacillus sp. V3-13]|uniref:HpcH/HpaI aldolase/citrate lyase family protein n=1 Tax=Bacillus sp. V3-13 TaxID=2053728 RepID=UPI000C792F73|nr:CoA ester lyase [Bacillus sp. V3-13]PLR75903.1 CoA ester lyase [Bacillus sp. V3-13]
MGIRRSYLFVPSVSVKMMEKAVASDSDCVIFDLEDAVAINEKEAARERIKQFLNNNKPPKEVFIRINDMLTSFWRADLETAIETRAAGIIVPKAENAANMIRLCEVAEQIMERKNQDEMDQFKVLPLIETAAGVHFAYEIAASHQRIPCLVFGSIDYSLDVDCELTEGGEELFYARSQIVNASRAAGKGSPVDAVYPDLANEKGLKLEALRAKQLGFKAKLAIHPKQLAAIHEVFTPSQKELDNAMEIVSAFEEAEQQGVASISVGKKLVDYPVYKKAKGLLQYSVSEGVESQ